MSNRDYLRPISILRRLKRCPYCGSNVMLIPDKVCSTISCMNKECGAIVSFNGAETDPEETIRRWNNMIPDTNRSLTND